MKGSPRLFFRAFYPHSLREKKTERNQENGLGSSLGTEAEENLSRCDNSFRNECGRVRPLTSPRAQRRPFSPNRSRSRLLSREEEGEKNGWLCRRRRRCRRSQLSRLAFTMLARPPQCRLVVCPTFFRPDPSRRLGSVNRKRMSSTALRPSSVTRNLTTTCPEFFFSLSFLSLAGPFLRDSEKRDAFGFAFFALFFFSVLYSSVRKGRAAVFTDFFSGRRLAPAGCPLDSR